MAEPASVALSRRPVLAPWLELAESANTQWRTDSSPPRAWTVKPLDKATAFPLVDVARGKAMLSLAGAHPQAHADRLLALMQARWGARWDLPFPGRSYWAPGSKGAGHVANWRAQPWGEYIDDADAARVNLIAAAEVPDMLARRGALQLLAPRDMLPNDYLDPPTIKWFLRHVGMPQFELGLQILSPEDQTALGVTLNYASSLQCPLGTPMWAIYTASRLADLAARSELRHNAEAGGEEGEHGNTSSLPANITRPPPVDEPGPPGHGWRPWAAEARLLRALGAERKSLAQLEASAAWRSSGPMYYPRMELTRRQPALKRGRGYAARETGVIPRYVHRYATDGAIFGERIRRASGTILLDWSGSMSLHNAQVEELLHLAPASTLAVYAGQGSEGNLRIMVRRGRMVGASEVRTTGGGNDVDFRALCWLARQRGPRYWISDGGVSCIGTDPPGGIAKWCGIVVRHHLITQMRDIDTLLKHFRLQYRR